MSPASRVLKSMKRAAPKVASSPKAKAKAPKAKASPKIASPLTKSTALVPFKKPAAHAGGGSSREDPTLHQTSNLLCLSLCQRSFLQTRPSRVDVSREYDKCDRGNE